MKRSFYWIVLIFLAVWLVGWNRAQRSLLLLLPAIAEQRIFYRSCNCDNNQTAVEMVGRQPVRFEMVMTILSDKQQSKRSVRDESDTWLLSPEVQDIPVTICSPDRLRRRNPIDNATTAFRPDHAFSGLLNANRTGKVTILPMVNGFRAGEAPGYLTYILNNWDSLPDVMIFLHGDPFAHNRDILSHIRRIISGDGQSTNTSWTLQQIGFLHLNLGPMLCRLAVGPPSTPEDNWPMQWELMGFDPKSFPGRFKLPCCAQFMVTKERILLRPKWFYQQALKVVYEFNDGGFLEHIWHIVFGEQAILSADREFRTYAISKWTKPVQDAVLHKPYINHEPLYLTESMKPWHEMYLADPSSYYPVIGVNKNVCPPEKYCYKYMC